jgi:hypothetical protein
METLLTVCREIFCCLFSSYESSLGQLINCFCLIGFCGRFAGLHFRYWITVRRHEIECED